jgi:hypothetical protein
MAEVNNGEDVQVNKNQNPVSQSNKRPRTKIARRWTDMEVSHLIELYEERSVLWNIFDKNYHKREIRNDAFAALAEELDIPLADVKAKLTSLRAYLGKEIADTNKSKSGQSTDQLYASNWVYWERLQFLKPMMQASE